VSFTLEKFSSPTVAPETATLFRRTPYITPSEYRAAPTAIATSQLVPGGSEDDQVQALAAVIMRASDWIDTLCFHKADGTLAASPTVEAAWITPKANGTLAIICNYKPILEVDGLAVGGNAGSLQNVGAQASEAISIQGQVFYFAPVSGQLGTTTVWPSIPTTNGKVYAVWSYVNGFPHVTLGAGVAAGATSINVKSPVPGGSEVFGVYPGTQLTIHDGANTEVIVVKEVEGLTLKLTAGLEYAHVLPESPDSIRVSALPWAVEQAAISLTTALIKTRGSRAMTMPQVAGGMAGGEVPGQAGQIEDYQIALDLLQPFIVPNLRST
jgi:hypothetical protein